MQPPPPLPNGSAWAVPSRIRQSLVVKSCPGARPPRQAADPQFRGGVRSLTDFRIWTFFRRSASTFPSGASGGLPRVTAVHSLHCGSEPRPPRAPSDAATEAPCTPAQYAVRRPQSVRNPPISTTYGEEVPRHREDDLRRCPEAAPSESSAKCCPKAASGVTLLERVTTWQRTAVSGSSPTSSVTPPRAPPLAVLHAPPSHPSFRRSSGRTRSWRAISCGVAGDTELAVAPGGVAGDPAGLPVTPGAAIEQAGGARSEYVLLRPQNAPRLRQPIGITLPPLINPHA